MPQATMSFRLRNGTYLTKTVTVTDEPRPRGLVWLNSHSVWLRRYVREYFGVGVHQAGEWLPRTAVYPITASRRKLVKPFIQATSC